VPGSPPRIAGFGAGAPDNRQQALHRRHFLQLLPDEPVQKSDGHPIFLLKCPVERRVDLPGDLHLPLNRQLERRIG